MTRFVTSYKPAGTRGFRCASTALFGEFGGNAQNTDKDFLPIFTAPTGRVIVQADQKGAESVVVAHLAPAGRLREVLYAGIKPHTVMALALFPEDFGVDKRFGYRSPAELIALPEWKDIAKRVAESPYQYDVGKRTVHASSYCMGPRTFQLSNLKYSKGKLALPYAHCKAILAEFALLYPDVIQWQNETKAEAMANRVLYNLFGFPRECNRVMTDAYLRELVSFKPQSTVGCITHFAIDHTQDYIEDNDLDWHVVNNKHDSFACEIPDDPVEILHCAQVMHKALAITLTGRDGVKFTMDSDVKAGKNWADFSEKNPLGMRKVELK